MLGFNRLVAIADGILIETDRRIVCESEEDLLGMIEIFRDYGMRWAGGGEISMESDGCKIMRRHVRRGDTAYFYIPGYVVSEHARRFTDNGAGIMYGTQIDDWGPTTISFEEFLSAVNGTNNPTINELNIESLFD